MDQETRERIQEIINGMTCPKDFQCAESGFEMLCEAKDVGLKTHLMCLDTDPAACGFAMRIDDTYFCECPLRVYVAKKLSK